MYYTKSPPPLLLTCTARCIVGLDWSSWIHSESFPLSNLMALFHPMAFVHQSQKMMISLCRNIYFWVYRWLWWDRHCHRILHMLTGFDCTHLICSNQTSPFCIRYRTKCEVAGRHPNHEAPGKGKIVEDIEHCYYFYAPPLKSDVANVLQ